LPLALVARSLLPCFSLSLCLSCWQARRARSVRLSVCPSVALLNRNSRREGLSGSSSRRRRRRRSRSFLLVCRNRGILGARVVSRPPFRLIGLVRPFFLSFSFPSFHPLAPTPMVMISPCRPPSLLPGQRRCVCLYVRRSVSSLPLSAGLLLRSSSSLSWAHRLRLVRLLTLCLGHSLPWLIGPAALLPCHAKEQPSRRGLGQTDYDSGSSAAVALCSVSPSAGRRQLNK
jgi:hypothetical protein